MNNKLFLLFIVLFLGTFFVHGMDTLSINNFIAQQESTQDDRVKEQMHEWHNKKNDIVRTTLTNLDITIIAMQNKDPIKICNTISDSVLDTKYAPALKSAIIEQNKYVQKAIKEIAETILQSPNPSETSQTILSKISDKTIRSEIKKFIKTNNPLQLFVHQSDFYILEDLTLTIEDRNKNKSFYEPTIAQNSHFLNRDLTVARTKIYDPFVVNNALLFVQDTALIKKEWFNKGIADEMKCYLNENELTTPLEGFLKYKNENVFLLNIKKYLQNNHYDESPLFYTIFLYLKKFPNDVKNMHVQRNVWYFEDINNTSGVSFTIPSTNFGHFSNLSNNRYGSIDLSVSNNMLLYITDYYIYQLDLNTKKITPVCQLNDYSWCIKNARWINNDIIEILLADSNNKLRIIKYNSTKNRILDSQTLSLDNVDKYGIRLFSNNSLLIYKYEDHRWEIRLHNINTEQEEYLDFFYTHYKSYKIHMETKGDAHTGLSINYLFYTVKDRLTSNNNEIQLPVIKKKGEYTYNNHGGVGDQKISFENNALTISYLSFKKFVLAKALENAIETGDIDRAHLYCDKLKINAKVKKMLLYSTHLSNKFIPQERKNILQKLKNYFLTNKNDAEKYCLWQGYYEGRYYREKTAYLMEKRLI